MRQAEFWTATPVPPQPLLAQLRKLVFEQSEKRSPKWEFRIAPDLVVQIQAKLSASFAERFECIAVECDKADAHLFTLPLWKTTGVDYWRLTFDLYALKEIDPLHRKTTWRLKPGGLRSKRGQTGDRDGFRQRVVGAFKTGRFDRLQPDLMLGHWCLCCGKGLTDPVSMARGIGPECWGSASPIMPFIVNLDELEVAS